METGVGQSYRDASRVERLADAARRTLTHRALRRLLKAVYHRALSWLPGEHLTCRLPDGEVVRIDAAHRFIAWNPIEYRALKRAAREGATVLDIGANVGAYTLLFAQWVGPRGRVYAFEPAPSGLESLRARLTLNGVGDRVRIVGDAVSGESGRAPFEASGCQGDNRLTPPVAEVRTPTTIEVRTTTIDEFCERAGIVPDLIKMDIEGAELGGLQGARRTIAAAGPSLALFVEFHPTAWTALGVTREQIERELAEQDLTIDPAPEYPDPWSVEGVCVRLRRARRAL